MANALRPLVPVMAEAVTRWRSLGTTCSLCGGTVPAGGVVVIGDDRLHRHCAVTAAAGIAASVLDGDDSETAHDTMQAAGILADAARVLAAKCGGRA